MCESCKITSLVPTRRLLQFFNKDEGGSQLSFLNTSSRAEDWVSRQSPTSSRPPTYIYIRQSPPCTTPKTTMVVSNSVAVTALGGVAATYVFLLALLHFTQASNEPPAVLTTFPFVSPILGMVRWSKDFYSHMRYVLFNVRGPSKTYLTFLVMLFVVLQLRGITTFLGNCSELRVLPLKLRQRTVSRPAHFHPQASRGANLRHQQRRSYPCGAAAMAHIDICTHSSKGS